MEAAVGCDYCCVTDFRNAHFCSLKARFAVASKKAGLRLEEKNVQLFALVSVCAALSMIYKESVDAVEPRSGQRYDRVSGVVETHTLPTSGMLFI